MVTMAIVKNNYVKQDGREKQSAKRTIRYIQHRSGKDGAHTSRTLFGNDGIMGRHQAYRMIDEAGKGSIFFRFVLSPDPKQEDKKRDLHMREVTEKTMLRFEERMNKQVQWVAAVHADHTEIRHVHIVAVVAGRLQRQDFQALPQVLRGAATEACMEQRRELDLVREQQTQEREGEEWERSH
jgi:hypothetical protein